MEKSTNIEDQAIDQLLKSFIRQPSKPEATCEGFDADLASLYLERVLTQIETSRFEIHLFQCSPCRTSIIALARLMEQEVPLEIRESSEETQAIHASVAQESKVVRESKITIAERLKSFLGLLATPRLALPVVAALVLAISIPFIISQRSKGSLTSSSNPANEPTASAKENPKQTAEAPATAGKDLLYDNAEKQENVAAVKSADSAPGTSPASRQGEVAGAAGATTGNVSPASETAVAKDSKEETKSDSTGAAAETKPRADETAARASEPPPVVANAQPAAPPPAPKTEAKEKLGYIDPATTTRPPTSERDANPTTLKPGNTGATDIAAGNRPGGATIRPGDNEAQPPATSADAGRRTELATRGKSSLRDEREVRKERARASASRVVNDKTFFLIDDVWTDQKYNKDKELPIVPVIKDSDVYKALLEKHSGLQKFFKGFAANEKVLVVYKGTVYRLLPQDGK
jgi:hypothetical protein